MCVCARYFFAFESVDFSRHVSQNASLARWVLERFEKRPERLALYGSSGKLYVSHHAQCLEGVECPSECNCWINKRLDGLPKQQSNNNR